MKNINIIVNRGYKLSIFGNIIIKDEIKNLNVCSILFTFWASVICKASQTHRSNFSQHI